VADGMATPLALAEYEKMFKTLGGKPVHATLAFRWQGWLNLCTPPRDSLSSAGDC